MSAPVFKRILLKLSGEALAANQGFGVDPLRIHEIAAELADVHTLGIQIAIVVGGGNFFRGVAQQAREMDRVSADHMGMLATVINALALQDALEKQGIHTRVQSAIVLKQGLQVMDSPAISLCKDNNLPIIIFNLNQRGNIRKVVVGEKIGSLVSA